MARRNFHLNSKGIAAILRSRATSEVTERAARAVADGVQGQRLQVGAFHGEGEINLPVKVTMTTTDRAHANVTLAHPAGQAVQAKHGALTKAAAQAGLDVTERKS